MSPDLISFVERMQHSPAHNYVIPGLTSWLIGAPHPVHGCVRLFTMSRHHEEPIIPHSHRFDFRCLVLRGKVHNHIWYRDSTHGDVFEVSDVTYEGELGKHQRIVKERYRFSKSVRTYAEGEEYGMRAEEFHSIYFERGTSVLFFEGPNRLDLSQVLEPVVDNETIPLFRTEPWMFRREITG
jgi:hypothetical protein